MDLMQMNLTRTKRLKILAIGELHFSKQRGGSNYNIDMQIGRWGVGGGGGVYFDKALYTFCERITFYFLYINLHKST